MSADNYMYVQRLDDGRYAVSHRSASMYYADEGHTVESLQASHSDYVIDGSWIAPAKIGQVFDTFEEADASAHEEWTEYGVRYAFEIKRTPSTLSPPGAKRDEAVKLRLVYCTRCHKTHCVSPSDVPCEDGHWLNPEPIS